MCVMTAERTTRRSATEAAMRRSLVERARARSPEERIVLALELGDRCRLLARAHAAVKGR
ncbi:MAG: hypothetical protein A2138_08365 [Deltaproteobacteria bacterium RBG_16_71_12]|nr:MAG: hypothetical protein A2138_08365 [Deltaproteobacteria bacterium RBG_16_71_12]